MFVVSWKFEKNIVGADGLIYNGYYFKIIIIIYLVTILFITTAVIPIVLGIIDIPYLIRKHFR